MNNRIIGIGGTSIKNLGLIGLLDKPKSAEEKLPEEEKKRRASIIRNSCPTCKGKLVRGKKNKKNEYKRDWNCTKCRNVHSI